MRLSPLPEGYVNKGLLMAAYPTYDQVQKIEAMQPSLKACWNWLVSRIEEVLKAKEARAMREGLLPAPVPKPNYDGLQPEQSRALKQEYSDKCKERRKQIFDLPIPVEWRPFLSGKGSEAERLGMKYGYEVLNNYLDFKGMPRLPASVLAKLEENFKAKTPNQKRKKFKKNWQSMPVQVISGLKLRPRRPTINDSWHQKRSNYEVHLPSIGWIACYCDPDRINLLLTPGNTVREGCTLKYEHGRWFASVKIIRREIINPGPRDGSVCGIDPGLDKIAAVSDRKVLKNSRNLKYDDAKNLAISVINLGAGKAKFLDKETRNQMMESVYRHDDRQRRRVLTQCRQLSAKLCGMYDFIGIEANSGVALGIGSRFTGATKILVDCLIQRCGTNRIYQVDSYYNSQTCSKCGHHDKETWARKLGGSDQTCTCPVCGFTEDRDVNSACNVRNKLAHLLGLTHSECYYPCGG